MPSPCPQPGCTGTLHRRGKGRPPKCNICGYHEPIVRGRPRKNPKRVTREIVYALFDPALLPEGKIGYIHRVALVGTAIGCSRKSVERDRSGLRAVPIGSLTVRERQWVELAGF